MEFLIGFSFILLLAIFTVVLYLIARRLPKEALLVPVCLMMFGDAVLVALYYYPLSDIVSNVKLLKLGIAGAFAVASMGRAVYFLLSSKDFRETF